MKKDFLKIGAWVVFIISIIFMMKKATRLTRGLRNNNPFNMNETNENWFGQKKPSIDSRFAQFVSLDAGIRAGLVNLYNGYFSRGLSIREIVEKYSPASDNKSKSDTTGEISVNNYIKAIFKRSGVAEGEVPERDKWLNVAEAILFHENGMPVKSVDYLRKLVKEYNLYCYKDS